MSATLYDEAIVKRLEEMTSEYKIPILKPEETARLFSVKADESRDKISLPMFALSRRGYKIANTNRQPKSYDGIKIRPYDKDGKLVNEGSALKLNAIPIRLEYQLDIYTLNLSECEDFSREIIYEFVNNPSDFIVIPYNDANVTHNFTIHVEEDVEDNSDIQERIFSGQFTRYSIRIFVDDAYLFSIPKRKNVSIECAKVVVGDTQSHREIEEINLVPSKKKN